MVSCTRLWNGPACQDIISIRKINLHSTQHEQRTGRQEPNTPEESSVYIGSTQGDECITLDSTHSPFPDANREKFRALQQIQQPRVRESSAATSSVHTHEGGGHHCSGSLCWRATRIRRTRPTAVSTVTQHFFPSCRLDVISHRVKHRGLHGRGSLTIVTSPFRAWEQTILVPMTDLATSQTRSCASPRAESNIFMHVPNKMWEVAGAQKKTEAGFCHVHQLFRQMPQRPGPLDPPSAPRMVPARHHTPHQPTTMSMSDEAMVWPISPSTADSQRHVSQSRLFGSRTPKDPTPLLGPRLLPGPRLPNECPGWPPETNGHRSPTLLRRPVPPTHVRLFHDTR